VTAAPIDRPVSDLVTFDVLQVGDLARITVIGEIDSSTAPLLRTELDTVLEGAPSELVLDLDGVTFLDSAGLSVLAATHRRLAGGKTRLRLLASGRPVIRPMQITGLWDLLQGEQLAPGAGRTA
jgi:anti-sigma B factor antagonist